MKNLELFGEKTRSIAVWIICSVMLAIMGFLSVQSFLFTTLIDIEYNYTMESVFYKKDNILINIATFIAGCALMYLFRKVINRISLKKLMRILFVWFSTVGILWILSACNSVFSDSETVREIADSFTQGEYELSADNALYLRSYPFQIGFIAYLQLFMEILGLEVGLSTVVMQIVNVWMFASALCFIVKTINIVVDEKTAKLTAVLCMCSIQPVFFCVFAYGNIPSFLLASVAVYCMLKFMSDYKVQYALISAVSIGISIALKKNSSIILVAMIIILCFDFFKNKVQLVKKVAYLALCVVLSIGITGSITAFYAKRTNVSLHDAIPMTCWLAMGLGESIRGNGWYNGTYTRVLYQENEYNPEKTSAAAVEIIKQELEGFSNDLPGAAKFFYGKIVSQWNEPDYQSLWMSKITIPLPNRWGLGIYLTGAGEAYADFYMNVFQLFVYVFAAVGIYFTLKRKNLKLSIFALIILGGFLYHLLFEAKAQYSLIYFVCMFPLAANGIEELLKLTDKRKVPAGLQKTEPDKSKEEPVQQDDSVESA